MKSIAFYTLGCKLNFAETSTIAEKFRNAGYKIVDFESIADIYVIHTCSVTSMAEKKSRQAMRQAKRRNNKALIAFIGCYAELRYDEIKKLNIANIIIGNKDKYELLNFITNNNITINKVNEEFVPAMSLGRERTRSFLKIQDGCDYFCAYCTVPYARGPSRSMKIVDIKNMFSLLADKGIKEVVLTGVNVGDFGRKNGENLKQLLYELENIKKIERIRISSIEPDLLDTELIKLIADSEIIAPHFHLPLQSGSDVVLKLMGRRYNINSFIEKVELIKKTIPTAFIAADVITGFPGETDLEYEKTKKIIELLPLSELHVFTYSERPGTKAATMNNKISESVKKKRTDELLYISKNKKKVFYLSNKGSIQKVLWENNNYKQFMSGYTANYLKIIAKYDINKINSFETIKLTELNKDLTFSCISLQE